MPAWAEAWIKTHTGGVVGIPTGGAWSVVMLTNVENWCSMIKRRANTGSTNLKRNLNMNTAKQLKTRATKSPAQKPETVTALAAIGAAVVLSAKASGAVIESVRVAKAAMLADPLYITPGGKPKLRAIADTLVGTMSAILREARQSAEAAAKEAGHTGKFASAMVSDAIGPVVDALAYAKRPIVEMLGGADACKIDYDRKAGAYVVNLAIVSTSTKEPEESNDAAPAKGKGKAAKSKAESPAAEEAVNATEDAIASAFDSAPGMAIATLRDHVISRALREMFKGAKLTEKHAVLLAAIDAAESAAIDL